MTTLQDLLNNKVYKQVLSDSFGGIMYNVANRDKYNASEVLNIWNKLDNREQNSANGITKGAINFLKESEY